MSTEAFSSIPPLLRVALVDLVETKSPEESRAFMTLATQLATEVGGRRVIANETLVPMTIPDQNSTELEEKYGLLARHLAVVLGVEVRYVPSSDSSASISAMIASRSSR